MRFSPDWLLVIKFERRQKNSVRYVAPLHIQVSTFNHCVQVDHLSLQKIPTKLGVNLYGGVKSQTFTIEWSTSEIELFNNTGLQRNWGKHKIPVFI